MRLSNERPIIAIDRCHICLYLAHATCGFFGETGQVPTVEVPRQRPRLVRGRFICACALANFPSSPLSNWLAIAGCVVYPQALSSPPVNSR
ncbi:hypothetical protein E2H86_17290 [Pseudomonas putida]|nr:hypothetical protein E2H86_17290 [Pseudomonas putida]